MATDFKARLPGIVIRTVISTVAKEVATHQIDNASIPEPATLALIALGVAHAVQCPYCIDAYTKDCLEKGSNQAEMTEAIHVTCAIRGGASLVHGVQMMNNCHKVSL